MLSFPNTVFPRVALTYPSTHGEECFSGLRNGEGEKSTRNCLLLFDAAAITGR